MIRRYFYIVTLLASLAACGGNNETPTATPVEPYPPLANAQLVEQQILSYGDDYWQHAELHLPLSLSPPYTTLIVIHGGCWTRNFPAGQITLSQTRAMAAALADAGYAVWNVEYRAVDDDNGGWPNTFLDTAAAVDALRELATLLPLDLQKLVIIGHSAGGHLALWSAARAGLPADSALYSANPLAIHGVLSLAGVNDLQTNTACAPAVADLIGMRATGGGAQLTERLRETSPLQMLPSGVRSILATGVFDTVVPMAEAQAYVSAAMTAGDDSQFVALANSEHFAVVDPAGSDWSQILNLVQQLVAAP